MVVLFETATVLLLQRFDIIKVVVVHVDRINMTYYLSELIVILH